MVNVVTVRIGTGVHRLGALDGFPSSSICWWHPSQPSLISQCDIPGTQYVVLRNLLGDDSMTLKGWATQHWIQFLQADDDDADTVLAQAPNIPHLGGPYVPSVAASQLRTRGIARIREETSSPDEPPTKAARQDATAPEDQVESEQAMPEEEVDMT
eukprot:5708126-Prorocentrum_lima.AAC.1